MVKIWKPISKGYVIVSIWEATGLYQCGGFTCLKQMEISDRLVYRLLQTKLYRGAATEILSAIYEVDFLDFSYGFKPVLSPHQALQALNAALIERKINWAFDVDIHRFIDSVEHEWLLRMVAHRIADLRILRLIIFNSTNKTGAIIVCGDRKALRRFCFV
jgi:hypothetical protein